MALFKFDARQVQPDAGRMGPCPTGWYLAVMEKSEMKPNSSGTGNYLETIFSVIDGVFKDTKIYHLLNLDNPNEKAMQIAYGQLSAICHSVNYLVIQNDTSELHNKPLKINVKLVEAEGNYAEKNEIKAFKPTSHETPPSPTKHEPKAAAAAPKAAWTPGAPAAATAGAPPTQPWAAQPPAPAAATPTQPWAQQPAAAPQAAPAQAPTPTAAPAWQPPAGAPAQQPWAQQQPAAAPQPPAAAPIAPANAPQPWAPPAVQGGAPATAVPPWGQQPTQ